MTETSSRLLQLLALLQARRDWPGPELAGRLGVSARTVRRDVERLRALGYPVDALSGPAGGYRLRAGAAMPPLLLDDEEAVAIAVGLRGAASLPVAGIEETAVRALVKLEQILPSHLRRRVGALRAATATLPAGWWGGAGATVDPDALTLLAGACRDREIVRFLYRRRDGEHGRRRVEPHSLVSLGHRWYLVAWDAEREDWRTFRLDRLERPAAMGTRFAARELPGGDPAAFVARNLRNAQHRHVARVTLHAPAEELRARFPNMWGTLEPLTARTCEYRGGDDSLDWLALRIAGLGVDFEVHEPPALAERCRELGARLARAGEVRPARRRAAASAGRRR
ncbi:MAG TPA: YafY family protein [Conexibacter sp.]|nr:YafY family protein [Conexibacter sp.]